MKVSYIVKNIIERDKVEKIIILAQNRGKYFIETLEYIPHIDYSDEYCLIYEFDNEEDLQKINISESVAEKIILSSKPKCSLQKAKKIVEKRKENYKKWKETIYPKAITYPNFPYLKLSANEAKIYSYLLPFENKYNIKKRKRGVNNAKSRNVSGEG